MKFSTNITKQVLISKTQCKDFNKKVLSYKCKIRELQESLSQSLQDFEDLKTENDKLRKRSFKENKFKNKITRLKTEYESKMNKIIDEVKGIFKE